MGNLTYVTGANSPYFVILCAFLESFSEFCEGERIHVCDFGLSAGQCAFLEKLGMLRQRPPGIPGGLQPFYYKSSIGRYLYNKTVDKVVWIDCDCLILGSLGQRLHALSEELEPCGDYVAVSSDQSGSIGDFILRHKNDGEGTAPFGKLMDELGLSWKLDYLNSAVFLLRSKRFLHDWHHLSFGTPRHVLFEQNIFNCLAYDGSMHLHILDADIWNAHHVKLNRMEISPGDSGNPFQVFLDKKRVLVAHATSFMQRAVSFKNITIDVQGMRLNGWFKFIRNPLVRKLQLEYLFRFIQRNQNLLREFGLLENAGKLDRFSNSAPSQSPSTLHQAPKDPTTFEQPLSGAPPAAIKPEIEPHGP